ncbi:ABC transporter permease [Candidatus Bathyarchaeota archaeon]|nr:MAG: ABC transporter permease [Candidatus Bathyarchaeota archaeon]
MIESATELLAMMISAGTPLLLSTLGEIYAERSGILNLGVEGMMALGAVVAFYITLTTGNPALGLAAAAVAGLALSSLHAFISITIRSNQVVSGLALSMLGIGLSSLIGKGLIGMPLRHALEKLEVPLLRDIPLLGAFFRQNALTYLSYLLAASLWFIMFKTKIGICIRMSGENPRAADTMGVNVFRLRYLCTLLGGALAGLGGAYLSIAYTPAWIEGMTAGQGWIALALVIFAAWNPLYALAGAYLFGGIRVLQYRLQPLGISPPLLQTLPYVCTIVVLVAFSTEKLRRKLGAPSALGKPYSREER